MKIKPITTAAALLLALTSTAAFAEPLDDDQRQGCNDNGFTPLCETVYGVEGEDDQGQPTLDKEGLIHLVDDLENVVYGYEDPENNNEYVPGVVDYVSDFGATLYGYVDENNEEVPGLVDAVADLDNRAAALEALNLEEALYGNGKQGDEEYPGLFKDVEYLSEAVADYVAVLNELETDKADKVDLDKKADKVELDKKADKVALADKADKSQLATFQQQLDTKLSQADVDGKADKTELDKKADKADVIANKGAIAGLNNNVAANAAAINALNSSKLDKATFETLNTDFNKLQTAVSKLGTQVDANTARLGQLDRRVTKVQKEVRRGLATQSALAGLFQPYNVGKVNVTAAVGGYKSNTALAVGAGYRFNENVAAKAGVAVSTSGGGLSYNVGVNYEF